MTPFSAGNDGKSDQMAKTDDKDNKDTKYDDITKMSFERSLKELENIVGRLERGDVELEESIAIYERGEVLRAHCDKLLKLAEAKVQKLNFDQSGAPVGTEEFDPGNNA